MAKKTVTRSKKKPATKTAKPSSENPPPAERVAVYRLQMQAFLVKIERHVLAALAQHYDGGRRAIPTVPESMAAIAADVEMIRHFLAIGEEVTQ